MADVLFIHSNFPGQFGQLAYALTRRGHRVVAIASPTAGQVTGVAIVRYPAPPPSATRIEGALLRAHATLAQAQSLKAGGFDPQVVIGHPGWGETLFIADVFPAAKRILYGEYYTPREGGELGFDPGQGPWTLEDRVGGHANNLDTAMAYLEADRIVCPTPFQAGLMPATLEPRITVIHDGVDTDALTPDPAAAVRLSDDRTLSRDTPLITYVARKFEPLRGFHTLLRALPKALAALPSAQVLMIGSEGRGYGFREPPAAGWKAHYLAEVEGRLDLSRVHFVGKLPHGEMVGALQASSAHVYYTAPYVLSWSLIEAMACGALILGSDTAPVRDAIQSGENGLLGDFFDADALANHLILACTRPDDFAPLRDAARRTALERYDLRRVCLPAWMDLIDKTLAA